MAESDPRAEAPPGPLLAVNQVRAAYGRIVALSGVDLEVRRGQIVAIVGSNGAGKSTLLRVIAGQVKPTSGTVSLAGTKISGRRPDQVVRAGVALVPEGRQVLARLTVEENLTLGAYARRDRAEIAEDLARWYERFPLLQHRRRQSAGSLSGGEQQMLAIGRALMSRPQILLLDEPSLGLAPLIVEEVFAMVASLRADGLTLVLVEQNARQALRLADFAYVQERGRITLSGPGAELMTDPRIVAAYLGITPASARIEAPASDHPGGQ